MVEKKKPLISLVIEQNYSHRHLSHQARDVTIILTFLSLVAAIWNVKYPVKDLVREYYETGQSSFKESGKRSKSNDSVQILDCE